MGACETRSQGRAKSADVRDVFDVLDDRDN